MVKIAWSQLLSDINALDSKIDWAKYNSIYGVPRNGLLIALLGINAPRIYEPGQITERTLIIDDLIDSGNTLARFKGQDTAVLYRKPHSPQTTYFLREIDDWIELPFENELPAEDAVTRLIESLGENPHREGLIKTPKRVVRMLRELTEGYSIDITKHFESVFDSNNQNIIIVKDIAFNSLCEHHMLPFFGTVNIAYIPQGKVLGLSKFARIIDACSHKLQIQENLTQEIADILIKNLSENIYVVIKAQHLCMAIRGVKKFNSLTITSAISGVFKTNPSARAEALKLMQ